MRILVHDFGGYVFPLSLSQELAKRGHQVLHLYCSSLTTTPPGIGNVVGQVNLVVQGISLDESLQKYDLLKRWQQERAYGRLVVDLIEPFDPEVVISANTPLDAQKCMISYCRKADIPFVFWLQDLLGMAAHRLLSKKIPIFGNLIGLSYMHIERKLLKQSDLIIAITEEFRPFLCEAGIEPDSVHVIPNWAPIETLPVVDTDNAWAQSHDLDGQFCFLYAGSLGMKHNPALLLHLAHTLRDRDGVRVVVVSQGLGATWLERRKRELGLDNLRILPYQPLDRLPEVLATGSVLIALLNDDAGEYSVPSKVLSYLCAQRPLLIAVPEKNDANRLVVEEKIGLAAAPDDVLRFVESGLSMLENEKMRKEMADNARAYAETNFSIQSVADQFLALLHNTHFKDTVKS